MLDTVSWWEEFYSIKFYIGHDIYLPMMRTQCMHNNCVSLFICLSIGFNSKICSFDKCAYELNANRDNLIDQYIFKLNVLDSFAIQTAAFICKIIY